MEERVQCGYGRSLPPVSPGQANSQWERLWQRRWHPSSRSLLKSVSQFDESWLAASHAGEAYAEGAGLRFERFRKWGERCVRHYPERNDHGGVSGFCRNGGAARAGKKQRIQAIGFHNFVDAVRPRQRDVFGPMRFITCP